MTREESLVGRWVKRKSDGVEFQVMHLGRAWSDGRRPLYGRAEVAMADEVDLIDDGCCDGTNWTGPREWIGVRCGETECPRHGRSNIYRSVIWPSGYPSRSRGGG